MCSGERLHNRDAQGEVLRRCDGWRAQALSPQEQRGEVKRPGRRLTRLVDDDKEPAHGAGEKATPAARSLALYLPFTFT